MDTGFFSAPLSELVGLFSEERCCQRREMRDVETCGVSAYERQGHPPYCRVEGLQGSYFTQPQVSGTIRTQPQFFLVL